MFDAKLRKVKRGSVTRRQTRGYPGFGLGFWRNNSGTRQWGRIQSCVLGHSQRRKPMTSAKSSDRSDLNIGS